MLTKLYADNIQVMYGPPPLRAPAYGPPPVQYFYGPPPVTTSLTFGAIALMLLKYLIIPIVLIIGVLVYAKKKAFSLMKKWLVLASVLVIYFAILLVITIIIRAIK